MSKLKPNFINLKINEDLISIEVSKGRIHEELLFVLEMFSNLIKLNEELR